MSSILLFLFFFSFCFSIAVSQPRQGGNDLAVEKRNYVNAANLCLETLIADAKRNTLDPITIFFKFGFCEDEVTATFDELYRKDDRFAAFVSRRTQSAGKCFKSNYPKQVTVNSVVAALKKCFAQLTQQLSVSVDQPASPTPQWGYGAVNGPSTWPGICQTGKNQSPINIVVSNVTVDPTIPPLVFGNYDFSINTVFANNGHTEVANNFGTSPQSLPYIEGGGLPARYIINQFHFHWPSSEHTINGMRSAMAVHFLHIREDLTAAQALQTPTGVVAIAVLINICTNADTLQPLSNVFSITNQFGSNVTISYRPSDLLPSNTDSFYRYFGSYAFPGCQEVITWFIMTNTICVQQSEIAELQQHFTDTGTLLTQNFRPIQPLNGRQVVFRPSSTGK